MTDAVLHGLFAQILTDEPVTAQSGPLAAAVAFRAVTSELGQLSGGERVLLEEWLDRVISRAGAG
ncbi:hypothetical protein [Curtobacterium sp. TXMA1]|uniref:hypothetical protein n=1 Tax=Curtobacterium sp. TXMA1 TaxID=2876939 RepID=UPI001CCF6004|nr:hypothetical protein [Curtobacterium sp. TXMA1]UBQ03983.1 hypothetical protein LCG91_07500 [Curtobacterium sp. TXMA1]